MRCPRAVLLTAVLCTVSARPAGAQTPADGPNAPLPTEAGDAPSAAPPPDAPPAPLVGSPRLRWHVGAVLLLTAVVGTGALWFLTAGNES